MPSRGLSGGSRKHLDRIIPLLRDDPGTSDLRLFLAREQLERHGHGVGAEPIFTSPLEPYLGYPTLRRRLRDAPPDVVFVPTARVVPTGGAALAVMVRNMEPILRPREGNSVVDTLRNLVRARAARRACTRASRVLAVSEYVKRVLVERWQVDPRRIGVVPHGVEAEAPGEERRPRALGPRDPGRFVFTAGSIRPARGLEDLIPAFARARGAGVADSLVIAGETSGAAAEYRRAIVEKVRALGVDDAVVWAGNLDAREMAWCYRGAELFVMTSRAEACPNIVLEALAYGCLSVSTLQEPMPEFFGDAAVYYPGGHADALAARVVELLGADAAVREGLRSAALRRAAHYTWDRCAARTVEELALTIRARPPGAAAPPPALARARAGRAAAG